MHSSATRNEAARLIAAGVARREVCRRLGIGYTSTYRWQGPSEPSSWAPFCFRCESRAPHDQYTYLLGMYLGDGHIARAGRSLALRISCCNDYPDIMRQAAAAMVQVAHVSVSFTEVRNSGCTNVISATRHWPCMLPQHGPGKKHDRLIRLTPWQRDVVSANPRGLIKGLLHSDGYRGINTVHRALPTGVRTYGYPRYLFTNESSDIRGIFTGALDLLGIAWKQNRRNSISIARREAVAALDDFVGPKA